MFCLVRLNYLIKTQTVADFVQVAESLPLSDTSVDAVIGTLVLCSVKDVELTLQGLLAIADLITQSHTIIKFNFDHNIRQH